MCEICLGSAVVSGLGGLNPRSPVHETGDLTADI